MYQQWHFMIERSVVFMPAGVCTQIEARRSACRCTFCVGGLRRIDTNGTPLHQRYGQGSTRRVETLAGPGKAIAMMVRSDTFLRIVTNHLA